MKQIFLFLICILSFQLIQAQQKNRTQLAGKIIDTQSGLPLAGASIVLSENKNGTVSDSSGNYVLKNLPAGHALVEVSYLGYKSAVEHLDLAGSVQRDFYLQPSIRENETVIVTGIAGSSSIRKSPVPVTRISRSELIAIPATNLIDALSHQPGLSQVSTGPAISKPVIRGLGYNRLVVVNDGVRQEGQQWGDEHGIEIDENSVSKIEILKGPASLMYGSDAMAGVINIITTVPLPNNTVSGNILSSYQTNNSQRSLFANLGGNMNGFNWNAWGDIKAAGDYKNVYDGKVYNSKFREQNLGGYIGYNGNWGFTHFAVSNFDQRPGVIEGDRNEEGEFIKALPGGSEAVPSADDFTTTKAQVPWQQVRHLKFIADNRFLLGKGNITLNLGWQKNNRMEFGDPDQPLDQTLSFNLKTFNYKAIYHLDNHTGWNSSFGISGMQQANKIGGKELLIPEYRLFDAGAFIFVQKTLDKFTLSGGARYDIRDLNTTELSEGSIIKFPGLDKRYSNVSGSAGMTFEASEDLLLKANIAKGFRAPSIPELASNGAHEGTNRYEIGNPDMKSESSWQADAGLEYNSDHLFISASAFYNHIDNFIFYSKLNAVAGGDSLVISDGDPIPAYKFNQRTANLYGFEIQIDIHPHPLDWLHLENSFSYVRGRFAEALDGSDNLPLIPAAHWLTELRGEFLKKGKVVRNLSIYTDVDITFTQHNAFTGFQTETNTTGYTLLNAGFTGSLMQKNKLLLTFYLSGNNLADIAYQSHLSRLKYTDENQLTGRKGVFNMGRNFMFKINIPLQFYK